VIFIGFQKRLRIGSIRNSNIFGTEQKFIGVGLILPF
jgi:hypothetical protein